MRLVQDRVQFRANGRITSYSIVPGKRAAAEIG